MPPALSYLLVVIARLGRPGVTFATLAGALDLDDQKLHRLVRRAWKAGLIVGWPNLPEITLTPLAAERLGVRLNDAGRQWVRNRAKERPTRVGYSRGRTVNFTDLGPDAGPFDPLAPGPSADFPSMLAEAKELAEERKRRREARKLARPPGASRRGGGGRKANVPPLAVGLRHRARKSPTSAT